MSALQFTKGMAASFLFAALFACSSDDPPSSKAEELASSTASSESTLSNLDVDLATSPDNASKKESAQAVQDFSQTAPDLKAQRLVPLAFSRDGFPKIKRFFTNRSGLKVLERIEIDFNGDGRVDYIEYYDITGQYVDRDASDLDGDGRMNVTSFYKNVVGSAPELIKQEFDARIEGKTSVWKFFKNNQLARREIDRRGTGRADYWEYFENGRLIRSEKDDNSDGLPDSQPPFKQVVKPASPDPAKTVAPAPSAR